MNAEITITKYSGAAGRESADSVAEEAPLEIAIDGESLAVTMRTPGDDAALAAGFLYAEGVIKSRDDLAAMEPGDDPNLLNVALASAVSLESARRLQRNFLANSGCGVCGKASIAALASRVPPLPAMSARIAPQILYALSDKMRDQQRTFAKTGGLHAAGLFDFEGNLLSLREDVGRHNAVDKIVGGELLAGRIPLTKRILLVSGRASYEIMQKAAAARIPIVAAVSAPSSLAVVMARELNITLIGFLRGETMNVYAAPFRILS